MTKKQTSSAARRMLGAASALAIAFAFTAPAGAEDKIAQFDIPAQPLSEALAEFSRQSKVNVVAPSSLTRGKISNAVAGEMAPEDALETMIGKSSFEIREHEDGSLILAQATADEQKGRLFRVAQVDQEGAVREVNGSSDDEDEIDDRIVVTGTNIRGIAPDSSPTRTFDREDIQISGAATAQDFIQTQTFNFGGGSNEALSQGVPGDDAADLNTPGRGALGSSINLRGLGSGGTLVLLNGQRLAPSSGIGDFVDISMIPASALERVEVLTDGASSIYGGDAVAGVVNFILREDYDGVETSLRYGTVTDGDLNEYRASITGGKNWGSGNALLVYEYYKRDDLSAGDKPFSRDAIALPYDLLPSQERHSVLATANQEILPNLEISANVLYAERDAVRDRTSLLDGDVTRGKPSSTTLGIFAGIEWKVSDTWFVDITGTRSDVHTDAVIVGDVENMRENNSDFWTADLKTSGTFVQIPGGDIKLAVGGHYRAEAFSAFNFLRDSFERNTTRDSYAVFGEMFVPIIGPDNAVPGIERLELNVSGRFDHYSDFGSTANPKVGIVWSPIDSLRFRGSYGTSFNPPPLGRVGATDRFVGVFPTSLLNGAFGFTPADPSIADVISLVVQGTDKNLDAETSRAYTAGLDFDQQWNRHQVTIKATWFDIEFENRLGTAPCRTCTNNSVFDAPNVAFNDPTALPDGTVVFSPSLDQINNVLDSADTLFTALGDPLDAEIINFADVVRNLSRTLTSGVDFNLSYSLDAGRGEYLLGLDGTYLIEFKQQGANTAPLVNRLDTLYNPVDFRLRARAGYARDGFSANLFVNYVDGYREDNTADAARVDSWTTVDANLSYDTGESLNNSILANVLLRLSVRNLFDELPPSAPVNPNFGLVGFDPTNASPLGRFIAFEITKRF